MSLMVSIVITGPRCHKT